LPIFIRHASRIEFLVAFFGPMKPLVAISAIETRSPVKLLASELVVLIFSQALEASFFAGRIVVSGTVVP
jgi:hypothetical protein